MRALQTRKELTPRPPNPTGTNSSKTPTSTTLPQPSYSLTTQAVSFDSYILSLLDQEESSSVGESQQQPQYGVSRSAQGGGAGGSGVVSGNLAQTMSWLNDAAAASHQQFDAASNGMPPGMFD